MPRTVNLGACACCSEAGPCSGCPDGVPLQYDFIYSVTSWGYVLVPPECTGCASLPISATVPLSYYAAGTTLPFELPGPDHSRISPGCVWVSPPVEVDLTECGFAAPPLYWVLFGPTAGVVDLVDFHYNIVFQTQAAQQVGGGFACLGSNAGYMPSGLGEWVCTTNPGVSTFELNAA